MKRMLNSANPVYSEVMAKLEYGETVTDESLEKHELFAIRIIYNDPVSVHLYEPRARKWCQMSTNESSRLHLDHDSFIQHCHRAHLQVFEWRNARFMKTLIPSNFGWESKHGTLILIMHTILALPKKQSFSNIEDKPQEQDSDEYWTDSSDV